MRNITIAPNENEWSLCVCVRCALYLAPYHFYFDAMFRLSRLFLILVALLSHTLASASTAFAHKHRICPFNLVHSLVRVILMKSLCSHFLFSILFLLPPCQLRQRYSFIFCVSLFECTKFHSVHFSARPFSFLSLATGWEPNILWAHILSAFLFGFSFSELVYLIHCVSISQMLTNMTLRLITKSKPVHAEQCIRFFRNSSNALHKLKLIAFFINCICCYQVSSDWKSFPLQKPLLFSYWCSLSV